MTKDEALTLALEALKSFQEISDFTPARAVHAITAIKEALAQPEQEPPIDFELAYKWIYGAQALANALSQPEERNFCPRCGKRSVDIHTCTPPREKNT